MELRLILALLLCLLLALPALAVEVRTTRFDDTREALVNPMMGWVAHHYDNVISSYGSKLSYDDTLDDFPGLSTIYLRLAWSYIEPEEGQYNWSWVDGPAQRWIDKGLKVAFRFSSTESFMRYATPKWVEDAGAEGYNFTPGKEDPTGPYWEPEYDDPVFLAKLENFLAAAAKRYEGNPNVAFVDVGSFGVWGEGHTWASTQRKWPASTLIRHMELYRKHFPKTLLAANDDFSFQGDETIQYALEQGMTLRDDSIMVANKPNSWYHAEMAQDFWPHQPVVLESEHYGGSVGRGAWYPGGYLEAIEAYHASYASIHWWPREFLEAERAEIDQINQRLGYRLQLREASWPSEVKPGEAFELASKWANAGVAPCYPGGHLAWTLLTPKGGVATVAVDGDFDVRTLEVGPSGEAPEQLVVSKLRLPEILAPGEYTLAVSVGQLDGTPTLALPLAGKLPYKRYLVGKLSIVGDYKLEVGALTRQPDGKWGLPVTWIVRGECPQGTRPFAHFDLGGAIAFQGGMSELEGQPVEAYDFPLAPGTYSTVVSFEAPQVMETTTYQVLFGLWDQPNDLRLLGEGQEMDGRILIGELTLQPDGTASFTPAR